MKSSLEATKINGKHYFAATDVRVFSSVCYSKKAMRDAGLTDPRTLYYEGKWDWNTFMDYAKKLTNPSTGQKGFASVYPEGLISTTGKDYLSVDSKGNYKTNLTDPDIVRAMDMFEELGPAGIDAWKLLDWNKMMDEVKRGKIGMLVTPNPQLYLADAFKARTVTYAPLPKDPKADKYYEHFAVSGYYIPVGAKNIEGAVCYINSIRYTLIPELNQAGRERNKGLYGYTDDDYKLDDYRLVHSAPVTTNFERLNADITYESLWGKIIKNNRKWSSIVQEYTPVINGLLEKING